MKSNDQPTYQLACIEVWGGNHKVARPVALPGLAGWVYSQPLEPATGGGDVHYLSVCDQGILSRVVLADVSGHGQTVIPVAENLRTLMHKYISTWDQSTFMSELDHALQREKTGDAYATGMVLGFYPKTGQLLFTNAGHHPPLWYHAADEKWDWLHEDTSHTETPVVNLPMGLILGTGYHQTVVEFAPADLLLLYTDGLTEALDKAGAEPSLQRLRELARTIPVDSPAAAGQALLNAVRRHRNGTPASDDETLVVLHRLDSEALPEADTLRGSPAN